MIERFSIECRKTMKTKVITLANHNGRKQHKGPRPSELKANTCSWRQARENVWERGAIGFGFASHWLRKWREFL